MQVTEARFPTDVKKRVCDVTAVVKHLQKTLGSYWDIKNCIKRAAGFKYTQMYTMHLSMTDLLRLDT